MQIPVVINARFHTFRQTVKVEEENAVETQPLEWASWLSKYSLAECLNIT
jgi:hypothetical protein